MKTDIRECVICGSKASVSELVQPIDVSSWQALSEAARIQNFRPILEFSLKGEEVPDIYYHRTCRSTFTHKKTLKALAANVVQTSEKEPSSSGTEPRNLKRQPSQSRIYEEKCIFCEKTSKYKKGSNTREPLVKSCELRSDDMVRSIAIEKMDTKILSITSRELVAAEACYHKSCYRSYTRQRTKKTECTDDIDPSDAGYATTESSAFDMLYDYI